MEEVIRFLLARPAQKVDASTDAVPVVPTDDYAKALGAAAAGDQPRTQIRRLAQERRRADATQSVRDFPMGDRAKALLDALAGKSEITAGALNAAIKQAFGADASSVLKDPDFARAERALGDSVVTAVILGGDGNVPVDDAASLLRSLALVRAAAAGDPRLAAPGGLTAALTRVLALPGSIFPLATARPSQGQPSEPAPDGKDVERLRAERDRVLATYQALTSVSPEHLALDLQDAGPRRDELDRAEVATNMRPVGFMPPAEEALIEADPSIERERILAARMEEAMIVPPASSGGRTAQASIIGTRLRLRPEVVRTMSAEDQAVLAERSIDLTRSSVPNAVERLSSELQVLDLKVAEIDSAPMTVMTKVGNSWFASSVANTGMVLYGGMAAGPASVPTTYGSLAPAGIGDLLVVRQNLKRYEARELAHVENILKGEYKERVHRRARTTEETITTETETKKEEERDQQTTERFELKHESSLVQKEDASLKAGLAVSGKYGPVVEFKATADVAYNHAKEEATKVATGYSKDVTSRATTRIFERHVEQRILKTIEVFEETNTHGVDNKGGTGPVIGQYQWIDKVYEAQVFNYGKRLLYEIMLPEPASFLLYATASAPKAGADLVKPADFTLKPADISEWNYSYYVRLYEAAGVTPPPVPYTAVAKAVDGKGGEHEGATKAAELPIPDGFQAVSATVSAWFNGWGGRVLDVALGNSRNRFSDNGGWGLGMGNETGSVPFGLKTWKTEAFVVTVEIACQRTARAMEDWRIKTHAALMQGWQKLVRDYEERLAALQIEAAQQFQGTNPVENEQLVRAELKKGAISTITNQFFDLFGAINTSGQGYPEPNLSEAAAEGKYIRFFEQAFEWEQMMYFFYPYFWGRKSNWLKRALLQDVDPQFADFLKAGAARIVVSVRVGFEHAVAHFLESGEVWNGGDLPPIGSPLYVSIIEEIRERDHAPGTEVAQGDPWDVHLPTTLVILRDKAGLPSWQKDANGDWQPV